MDDRFLCMGLIMRDILVCGIKELPQHWEQTLVADHIISDTGGDAANSARTLGRLGANVALSGRLGDDAFGAAISSSLKTDHVDTHFLHFDPCLSSGVAVALVRDDGKRCFTTVRGANEQYCQQDLKDISWNDYPYIHINGYFQFPALEKDLPDLLKEAQAHNCTISFDMASWDASGRWYESIQPFARYIDYFFTNDAQLEQLTHCRQIEDAASFLMRDGVKNVVAKLGSKGCICFCENKPAVSVAGYKVAAIDTTGAGDSFDAAYILGISKGWDTKTCAQFANIVAGSNCTKAGATAGVPDYETALLLMRSYYQQN